MVMIFRLEKLFILSSIIDNSPYYSFQSPTVWPTFGDQTFFFQQSFITISHPNFNKIFRLL